MDLSRLLLLIPLLAFIGACTTGGTAAQQDAGPAASLPMPTPTPAPPPELMDATPLVDPATGMAVESGVYSTRLYFAEGSDELTDVTGAACANLARQLDPARNAMSRNVHISGYASAGEEPALAQQRADRVARCLILQGFPAARIFVRRPHAAGAPAASAGEAARQRYVNVLHP